MGDLAVTLVTTLADEEEGFEDEDRSDLSFLSCLPLSVPDETAGAALRTSPGTVSTPSDFVDRSEVGDV